MSKKTKRTVGWVAFYIFVAAFVVLLLLPFIWQFLTSVKPLNEIAEMPAKWIPSYFHGQFYVNVFTKHPFARYMLNSLIVATSATLLSLLIGASAAYALSRLHFKGRAVLLMVILGVSMFPTIATLSPLYLILKNMNLNYIGFSLPMAIWLMTNFFSQIEKGFEEAAAIDGCSHFQTFVKIMLPLIKPATFSVGLLVFINCWNEYLYSLTFMSKDAMRTVPVGIALFPSNYQLPWGDMAAASIVCTLPLIALVLIFQKNIVAGLTTGGMKG